jgi:YD repeat-containing protein
LAPIRVAKGNLGDIRAASQAYQGPSTNCWAVAGELCSTTSGAGNTTAYGYDSLGEVTSITQPAGSCSTGRILCTTIGYDRASRPNKITDGKNQATNFTYDADNRITQILYKGATTCTYSAGTCIGFGYDTSHS